MPPSSPPPKRIRFEDGPCIQPNAAGMDIGARALVGAVPIARDATPVRAFATCPPDLPALGHWLLQCGLATVAMEATGVSWVPIFE